MGQRERRMGDHTGHGPLMDGLEARTLMASAPLPDIGSLQNVNNTVVRLQMNFGTVRDDIDIELFDSQAPITVANFLDYVRDGDFDKTFFHRSARNNDGTPFVIQGGLARLEAPTTTGVFGENIETVPTDPAITNEFASNRSNVQRTVAMARVGGQVNSATSQFFVNLANNTFLDTVDQGFTVFGRILDDRSWAVVQQIAALDRRQLAAPYGELPVAAGFTGTNVTESQLVTIVDAEVIKPANVAEFYRFRYYYPEGFAGGTITEFLPIGNPGDVNLSYQVIARVETREARPTGNTDFWYRDKVIDTGSVDARTRAGFRVSSFGDPATNRVPSQGKPYAFEVWSTHPVAATVSRYDFGFSTIEAMVGGRRSTTGLAGDRSDTTWAVADIRRGGTNRDFLVWQTTTDQPTTVTVRFILGNGSSDITRTFPTEALRRGGLAINDVPGLPEGNISAVITSDRPIIVAHSHFKTSGADRGGTTQIGLAGEGSRSGVLPLGNLNALGTINDQVSIVNPSTAGAIVTLIFQFDDDTPDLTISPGQTIIGGGSRVTFNLNTVPSLLGKRFSLRYSAGITPVYASVLHVENNDIAAAPMATTAAPIHDFGEGFINRDRTDVLEQLAFYNPNDTSLRGRNIDANLTIRFGYTDGTVITRSVRVNAGRRLELILDQDAELRQQNAAGRFFFSINVTSDVPIVAAMRHYDLSLGTNQAAGGGMTIGTQRATNLIPVIRIDQLSSLG